MLPHFERGDMIILQGVRPADIKAPEVEISKAQFDEIYGRANTHCNSTGVIDYVCSSCTRISATDRKLISTSKCAREIRVSNQVIDENFSNDVIVYIPTYVSGVPYGGDIIHRVFVKLKVDGKYYFLTKGDNNDAFDASAFNIIREEDVKGRVVARIPWLGYLKLFISGSFTDPKGCEVVYAHTVQ
jgi:signal peptidase I